MKFETIPNNAALPEKKSSVKFGIDPTSDKLHLGHLIPLRIVKDLMSKGHEIDIVLGTFTAQMGDPSGKDKTRPILSEDETKKNAASILEQVSRVLGGSFKVHFNHTWFEKMTLPQIMSIVSKFTTTHLLSRDSFQKRIENNSSIGMHELMVPILQGVDSVELKSDIEVGGNDQLFNFLISRDLQEKFGLKPEICILAPIINGTDGRKMSKSFNNCIFINDRPEDVFGKTMSISDEVMMEWLPIFIETPKSTKPFDLKKELSFEVTKEIWGEELAKQAQATFERISQERKLPETIVEIDGDDLVNIICKVRKSSKTESRKLILANGVSINGEKIGLDFKLKSGDIIKIGKRDFVKIK